MNCYYVKINEPDNYYVTVTTNDYYVKVTEPDNYYVLVKTCSDVTLDTIAIYEDNNTCIYENGDICIYEN